MIEQAVIVGLAAWRITALLSYERGPWDIFFRLREFLGYTHNDNGEPVSWPLGGFREIFACPWCLSIWAALSLWGIWELQPIVVMVIAASGIAIAVERWNHQ